MGQIYWTGQINVIARFLKSADGRENSADDLRKMHIKEHRRNIRFP